MGAVCHRPELRPVSAGPVSYTHLDVYKRQEQQSQQDKNAQQQSDTEASRLKYTEEAQKAYERLQTPLEKYTARQEELNKALKDLSLIHI